MANRAFHYYASTSQSNTVPGQAARANRERVFGNSYVARSPVYI